VVGQRKRLVPSLDRGRHELFGQRGAVEEREGGVAVKLGVRHDERMFASASDGSDPSRRGEAVVAPVPLAVRATRGSADEA
jgi:hypothetical protein